MQEHRHMCSKFAPPPTKNARIWHPPKCKDLAKNARILSPKNARKKCKEKTQGSKKTRIGRSGWRLRCRSIKPRIDSLLAGDLVHHHLFDLCCIAAFGRSDTGTQTVGSGRRMAEALPGSSPLLSLGLAVALYRVSP